MVVGSLASSALTFNVVVIVIIRSCLSAQEEGESHRRRRVEGGGGGGLATVNDTVGEEEDVASWMPRESRRKWRKSRRLRMYEKGKRKGEGKGGGLIRS